MTQGQATAAASTATPPNRGAILVISGPSGVGKSTVCHELCRALPADFSISVTTRPQRPGETNERDYRFISTDEFERLRVTDALLESATVYGHHYGTPIEPVRAALAGGRVIVLEIDIAGAIQVRRRYPKAVTFFLLPPNAEEQRRRIVDRKTDAAAEIAKRLARADGEVRFASESGCYDHFIVNDDLHRTVAQIVDVIKQETGRN